MNILYCGDKNISDGLIISILSILKHTKEELHIYCLTADIKKYNISPLDDKIIKFLNKYLKNINKKNFIKKIDISDMFKKELPLMNIETRFTPCCMLRLFSDEIKELPSKILYLDNDVVCYNDPTKFYNLDIKNYEIAGVLDHYGSWFFRKRFYKRDYLNSGVLLINLSKVRKTKLFKRARRLCITKKMFMPDQSAINKLSKNKLIVNRKYNDQKKLKSDTVFRHFTTTFRYFPYVRTQTVKPWDVDNLHKILKTYEFDDIIDEYKKIKDEVYE